MKIKDTKPTGGVFRTIKTDQYFTIKNEVFNREDLSWAAMGVLGYILSKPNGWTVRTGDLINRSKSKGIGKYIVQNIINELKEKGYMRRFVVRDEEGKLTWVTETYESIELNPYYNPITQLVEYPQDGISTNEVEYKLTEEVVNTDKEINTEVAQLSQPETQGETMDTQDETMDKPTPDDLWQSIVECKDLLELAKLTRHVQEIEGMSGNQKAWLFETIERVRVGLMVQPELVLVPERKAINAWLDQYEVLEYKEYTVKRVKKIHQITNVDVKLVNGRLYCFSLDSVTFKVWQVSQFTEGTWRTIWDAPGDHSVTTTNAQGDEQDKLTPHELEEIKNCLPSIGSHSETVAILKVKKEDNKTHVLFEKDGNVFQVFIAKSQSWHIDNETEVFHEGCWTSTAFKAVQDHVLGFFGEDYLPATPEQLAQVNANTLPITYEQWIHISHWLCRQRKNHPLKVTRLERNENNEVVGESTDSLGYNATFVFDDNDWSYLEKEFGHHEKPAHHKVFLQVDEDMVFAPSVFGQVGLLQDEKDALIARLLRENAELKQGKVSHEVWGEQLPSNPKKHVENDDKVLALAMAVSKVNQDHSVDTNKMVSTTAVSSVDLASGQDKTAIATYQNGQLIDSVVLPNSEPQHEKAIQLVKQYEPVMPQWLMPKDGEHLRVPIDPLSSVTLQRTDTSRWFEDVPLAKKFDESRPYKPQLPQDTNITKGMAFVNGQWVEISLTPEQVKELTKPQMVSISFAVDTPQLPLGFATPPLKSPAMVDSGSKGTKRTTSQNSAVLRDFDGDTEACHDKAMAISDDAYLAKRQGDTETAKNLYLQAMELERQAAMSLPAKKDSEPTRSILCRSAASLAYLGEDWTTAKELIKQGLSKYAPGEIKDELLDLRKEVNKAVRKQTVASQPPKVNLAQDFLKRWCEEVLCYGKRDEATGVYEKATYAISWAMEMKGVKTLLANGRTFDENYADARAHYHYLKQQAFWQDKHISIQAVAKDLNAWIQRGRPTEQPKPQWQVDKAQREVKRDETSALWDELVGFTGGIDSSGTKRPLRYGRDRGKVAKSLMSKGLLAVVEKMSSGGMYSTIVDMTETDMKFAFLNAVKKVVKE